ncbi:MAG: D-aminoacylase [Actinobacteria bacterium]|nr:D-aminoacylase [Actinomycetota bacterium]
MNELRLTGAVVVDGAGAPRRRADVAVRDGRVVAVGDEAGAPAARTIDLDGLVLTPGFIDLHTHVDFTLPRYPRAASMVRQGVTTLVAGNCGFSPFPVADDHRGDLRDLSAFIDAGLSWDWHDAEGYLAEVDAQPLACNLVQLVGHGSVRVAVMGFEAREPTRDELDRMRAHVDTALRAGACGLSTGLVYAPGSHAGTDEIVALARVAAARGRFYASHIRSEGDGSIEAVAEALTIGARAGAAVELSHHKAMGRDNWGKVHRTLAMIDAARDGGLDVAADQYPYLAASTTLSNLLPAWARNDGLDGMLAIFDDPQRRAALADEVRSGASDYDLDQVMVASVPDGANADAAGRMLVDIAAADAADPTDTLFQLLAEERDRVQMVVFGMDEDDVRTVMTHPYVAVASDGWTLDPSEGGTPHPRSYGTFARVLGRYVRDEGVLQLEEAVRKMTSLPAARLGMDDLGAIRLGARADLVAFDPQRVRDRATFEDPHRFADGVELVVVGGQVVIAGGRDTGVDAGAVLRSTT